MLNISIKFAQAIGNAFLLVLVIILVGLLVIDDLIFGSRVLNHPYSHPR